MLTTESKIALKEKVNSSLHIPNLMPDEIFQGYYGRLLKVNGIAPQIGNVYLNDAVKNLSDNLKNLHAIFKIAFLTATPAEIFINRHTLIPLQRATISINAKTNHDPGVVNKLISRLPKNGMYFCKDCVKEDMSYLGFSYWRKSHQFLGIDWCSKHNSSLCSVRNISSAFTAPSQFMMANHFDEHTCDVAIRENKYVKKFNELYQDYSDAHHTINLYASAKYLKDKAHALNFRTTNVGTRSLLSDLLIDQLPKKWASHHFPELTKSHNREFVTSIDGVTSVHGNGSKISSIFLAAAVLGVDDDQLLSILTTKNILNEPKSLPSDDDLIVSYIKYGGKLATIEKHLGVNSSLLARRLNTIGCPSLKNLNKSTIVALKAFYEGMSIDDILKIKSINVGEFMEVLRIGSLNVSKALNYSY